MKIEDFLKGDFLEFCLVFVPVCYCFKFYFVPQTFDAMDRDGYLYACYYVSLIVIGSFFVLNLVLGVLSG